MSTFTITEPGDGSVNPEMTARSYALSEWSRFPEIVAYADRHGMTWGQAIESLVNSGLSHQRSALFDCSDPKSVAHYVADQVSATTDGDAIWPTFIPGDGNGCYMVEVKGLRLAIGEDPIDGGGLTWATYYMSDSDVNEDYEYGGWVFGDYTTAAREVESLVRWFCS